jgi:hypothetical protein
MKNYLYVILLVLAFLLILTNAFFGHELLASSTEQVAHKYSIYVHLQPEWNNSKNILFDITNSWHNLEKSEFDMKDKLEFHNSNQLQYLNGRSYVELKHEFSNCDEEWKPILYRKAVDTVRNEIEYLQGTQISADPSVTIYPDIDNIAYSNSEQENKIQNAYAQFIPICTLKDNTTYDYSIKSNNEDIGFDVYFVPSIQERDDFFSEKDFDYYQKDGCFGLNKNSFSGTCKNISKNSGLLVVIPSELNLWVTKVTIHLNEIE